jgi:TPR repeat protein
MPKRPVNLAVLPGSNLPKALLVFPPKQLTLVIMDKPWFRMWFDRGRDIQREDAQTKADGWNAEEQFDRGLAFATRGQKTPDYAQAVHCYLQAANEHHPQAQFHLGMMLASGRGVPRDEARAVMWIRRAAQQGHAGAQHDLGLRNRRSSFAGLPQDALESNLEAYKWFRLAAAQGNQGSDLGFQSIALGLTREQVIEGNRRADTFLALSANPKAA